MFVKSFMEVAVTYRKSIGDTVLKPLTTTFVDENIVSAKELKACYGDRIAIISSDMEETVVKETAQLDTPDTDKDQVQSVVDFLEGNTDVLPEGTELISNEKVFW